MARRATLLLLVALVGAAAGAKSPGGFEVIVNPANPVARLDADFVRDAFLKRASTWGDGETIRPADLTPRFPARATFTREILRKTVPQLRSYWNQQIFSGKAVPPPEYDSEEAMVRYVLANRGAIGYLPADASPGAAKVVPVR